MRAFRWISTVAVLGVAATSFVACSDGGETGTGGTAAATTTTGDSTSTTVTGAGGSGGATSATGTGGGIDRPPAGEDLTRDILTTDLELDLTTLLGKATITLAGSTTSKAASFEIGDLMITKVSDDHGALDFAVKSGKHGSQLDVGVPGGAGAAKVVVEYAFKDHTMFDGWMAKEQVSFLWPYFCGNLFPCKSDPADGVSFTMKVTGSAAGMTAVFPASIPSDAPSYMPAIAVGKFTKLDLGSTAKGTKISAWHLPGQEVDAAAGTAHLKQVFDFYEKTYGDYTFGTTAGSVSADWGPGDYGGMEHHPYWHIGKNDFKSEEVHAHEAAHGWYGDGVRIACWEDFVLSEGTVSYVAAHALEQLQVDVWADYECELKYVCDPANGANTIALPTTCNAIDILNDPLWSSVPYMKGAYFYREVGKAIGAAVLDTALAEFYKANVGKAAKMQALIDLIKTKTDVAGKKAVDDLETAWLKTLDCPVDYTTLCP
jgi:peptidase M1-like protein